MHKELKQYLNTFCAEFFYYYFFFSVKCISLTYLETLFPDRKTIENI